MSLCITHKKRGGGGAGSGGEPGTHLGWLGILTPPLGEAGPPRSQARCLPRAGSPPAPVPPGCGHGTWLGGQWRRRRDGPRLSLAQLDDAQVWVKFVIQSSGSGARVRRAEGRVSARQCNPIAGAPGTPLAPRQGQPECPSVPMDPPC